MNELAEFNHNLQTQTLKILHEQQYGIYGFHFRSPRSMRVHTAINTLEHSHTHKHLHATPHMLCLPRLLLPFALLFRLGNKLIKIMEGNVFVLQGSYFNPLVQNKRAPVNSASNLHLERGQGRTGTQDTEPGDTQLDLWDSDLEEGPLHTSGVGGLPAAWEHPPRGYFLQKAVKLQVCSSAKIQ